MITIKVDEKFQHQSDRLGTAIFINLNNDKELFVSIGHPFSAIELAAAFRVLAARLEKEKQ